MNKLKKNIKLGSFKIIFLILVFINISEKLNSDISANEGKNIQLNILDKVSSKNYKIFMKIGEEKIFKNISIRPLKCKNSEFDDNPEITAYLQVKDIKNKDKDEVFIFNGWTFSSSPTVNTFDHPVYDIWLTKCFN